VATITLLTDFGLADTYVGQVKGAILAIAPGATLVDLTHAVTPQDVFGGAFLLWSAVEAFPRGTVHVAVVDPGVGSARRAIAIRCIRGDQFVGPDNGLLVPAVERLGGVELAVELSESRYWRPKPSNTFHGRDIFGPAAGHLANGVPPGQLGREIEDPVLLKLPEPNGLDGEVIHVDTFGNLITNIPARALPQRFEVRLQVRLQERRVVSGSHYAAVGRGELIALVGSADLLELSARDASAAELTGAIRGTRVSVQPV